MFLLEGLGEEREGEGGGRKGRGYLIGVSLQLHVCCTPSVDKGSVASAANAFASLTMDDHVSEEEEDEGGVPQELPEHACRCGGLGV